MVCNDTPTPMPDVCGGLDRLRHDAKLNVDIILHGGDDSIMNELLHKFERGFQPMISKSQRHISPPTSMRGVLSIRPRHLG